VLCTGDRLRMCQIDETVLLVCVREVPLSGMDWVDMAQDRDRWRALVNAVMNLRVP
jgi:hypothetical protein